MKTKEQKGKIIAENAEIRFDGQVWIVPSQSGSGEYAVDLQRQTCACPYFVKNVVKCKHQYAVEEKIWRQFQAVATGNNQKTRRPRTPRPPGYHTAYNLSQSYSDKKNLEFVESKSARPFIAFKNNAVFGTKSETWNKLLHFYSFHQDDFHERYRHRSNVESAFAAIKQNFGEQLRSRNERGQINELLAKFICHNLCVLVKSMFDLKIDIDLWKSKSSANLPVDLSAINLNAAPGDIKSKPRITE